MGLYLVTAPTREPVTVEEIKDHLRIDIDTEDELIAVWIKVARAHCEKLQNMVYLTQTWDWYLDDFPAVPIDVPLPPLQSVTSIKYTDTDDSEATVTASDYRIDTYSVPGRINLAYGVSWPAVTLKTLNGVVIRFVAGYTGVNKVPQETKAAIKLLVGHLYEHREETSTERVLKNIPIGIYSLLDIDRIVTLP
jgi:uncharacterized phiE125 gp8 family phage protein